MSSARRLGRSPVKVHPGESKLRKPAISRQNLSQGQANPFSSSVRRVAGTPTIRSGGSVQTAVATDNIPKQSISTKDPQQTCPQTKSSSSPLKGQSPPSPDCVANISDEDSGGSGACSTLAKEKKGGGPQVASRSSSGGGGEPSPQLKTTPGGSPAKPLATIAVKPQVPKLKVVLDMDECMIHSIFNEGIQPGRMPFARPNAPPPSPPPQQVTTQPLESFHLIMLDKAACVVNKRPHIDWFLEQVCKRFDTYVMTAGTRDYAQPLLDRLDPKGLLKGRFYRDSCVFHDGHYFKDLTLVDQDPRRVVLVDNNPASFVLCPANGIPVTSFYDDPYDCALEQALEVLMKLEKESDVRKPLRQMYNLETKLAPMVRHFQRRS